MTTYDSAATDGNESLSSTPGRSLPPRRFASPRETFPGHYTRHQLLLLCPYLPDRHNLPLPASVTEIHDEAFVSHASAEAHADTSRTFTLSRPVLRRRLADEDRQNLQSFLMVGNARRPAGTTGGGAGGIYARGAYGSGRGRGRGRGGLYTRGRGDEDAMPAWAGDDAGDAKNAEDLWADPKDAVGRFDASGRFVADGETLEPASSGDSAARSAPRQSRLANLLSGQMTGSDEASGLSSRVGGLSLGAPPGLQPVRLPYYQTWSYRDPHGRVQGPFGQEQMNEWTKAGYFPPSLLIKPELSSLLPSSDVSGLGNEFLANFVPLAKWMDVYGGVEPWSAKAREAALGAHTGPASSTASSSAPGPVTVPSKQASTQPVASASPGAGQASASSSASPSVSSAPSAASNIMMPSSVLGRTQAAKPAYTAVAVAGSSADPVASAVPAAGAWKKVSATTTSLKDIEAEIEDQQRRLHSQTAPAPAPSAPSAPAQPGATPQVSARPAMWATIPAVQPSSITQMLADKSPVLSKAPEPVPVSPYAHIEQAYEDAQQLDPEDLPMEEHWKKAELNQLLKRASEPAAAPTKTGADGSPWTKVVKKAPAGPKAAPAPVTATEPEPASTWTQAVRSDSSAGIWLKSTLEDVPPPPPKTASLADFLPEDMKKAASAPAKATGASKWSAIVPQKTTAPGTPPMAAPIQAAAKKAPPATAAPRPQNSPAGAISGPASSSPSPLEQWARDELKQLRIRDLDVSALVAVIAELPQADLAEVIHAYIPDSGAAARFIDGFVHMRTKLQSGERPVAPAPPHTPPKSSPKSSDDGFNLVSRKQRKPKQSAQGEGTQTRKVVGLV